MKFMKPSNGKKLYNLSEVFFWGELLNFIQKKTHKKDKMAKEYLEGLKFFPALNGKIPLVNLGPTCECYQLHRAVISHRLGESSFKYSRLFGEMERFTVPEVHRASLENSLLQVMALGIPLHRQGAGWSDGFSSSFFKRDLR